VVLNRVSGTGAGDETAARIVELFDAQGRRATVVPLPAATSPGDAARRVLQAGCRVIVAAGGDGTVSAVAGAAAGGEVPLGVLPLGTLNHFAKDLGIPSVLEEAVAVVTGGAIRPVDAGEVNGRFFINNSSLGVYPNIVELRRRHQGTGLGKWVAALWATLAVLRRRPFLAVQIHLPGETLLRRTPFVFVGNNEYRMSGLRAGSRASLAGGRLAFYVMHASRRRSLLRLGWLVLWRGVDQVEELELHAVTEASVDTHRRRIRVALDGELVMLDAPLRFRVRPAALRVLTPRS
jgi:diacylglycerol kinase family enzyme